MHKMLLRLFKTAIWCCPLVVTASVPMLQGCGGGGDDGDGGCCKVCSTGKACGDACIAMSDTCHAGKGCACNK